LVSAVVGRPVQIAGALEVRIFTLHPRLTAEQVSIGSPSWMPSGISAQIGKLVMVLTTPQLAHPFGIEELQLESATLQLARKPDGHANWQWSDPSKPSTARQYPIVRRLSIPRAHVVLDDQRRHLQFDGTVSVQSDVHIEASGRLNGRPVSIELRGDALAGASHEHPYQFSYSERSSGSRLTGDGSLPHPFDVDLIDLNFAAAGEDIKDLYFLTGVSLIDTGPYRLTGRLTYRGLRSTFADLHVHTGASDVNGSVSIDSSGGRPRFDMRLDSQRLHLADLGAHAAGRDTAPGSGDWLLSNASLNPETLRHGDATVNYRVKQLDVGRITLTHGAARARIEGGVLTAESMSAELYEGKIDGHFKLDARKDPPAAEAAFTITDLHLGLVGRTGDTAPPIEGPLQVRMNITGRGSSVHQVAASANGTLTAAMAGGAIRASLAELTGIDLRGLGLMLVNSTEQSTVRCAIADFKAQNGTLTAQNVILDSDRALIRAEGTVQLGSEALGLDIRGQPKKFRLFRLRSPVMLRGTLLRPSINLAASSALSSAVQLAKTGTAADADCQTLLHDWR
jgi:uncharacterized protein involved in outer membrane biogenesis